LIQKPVHLRQPPGAQSRRCMAPQMRACSSIPYHKSTERGIEYGMVCRPHWSAGLSLTAGTHWSAGLPLNPLISWTIPGRFPVPLLPKKRRPNEILMHYMYIHTYNVHVMNMPLHTLRNEPAMDYPLHCGTPYIIHPMVSWRE
jgi:hypothetical protein